MRSRGIQFLGIWVLVLVYIFSSYSFALDGAAGAEADNHSPTGTIERFNLVLDTPEATLEIVERIERFTAQATQLRETYAVKIRNFLEGYLLFDTYTFKNGDLYYYFRYTPESEGAADIGIIIPFRFDDYEFRFFEYPDGLDQTKSVLKHYDNQKAGVRNDLKNTSPSSIFLDSEPLSGYFSYSSVYGIQSHNIRKELYDRAENVEITEKGVKVTLPSVSYSFSEQWGIISASRLVDWNDETQVEALRTGDLGRVRKWGGDGQYYFLPYGYSPYSPNGFYRNSANHIGNKFLYTPGRFFEDYAYITIDTLIRTQNPDGYWGTDPLANGLFNDYKVGAGFFDTRWDTEGALSLLRGYRKFKEPQMLKAAVVFADYYCGFALSNAYITENGGLLVYDYGFDATPGIKTHVSLNHLVSEMNFLLEMYNTTHDYDYLNVANKILTGIRDTSKSWINKKIGDLYYGYYGDGIYGTEDYPTLTLNDLRYAQVLITTIFGQEEPSINMLIDSKEKYLEKQGIPF